MSDTEFGGWRLGARGPKASYVVSFPDAVPDAQTYGSVLRESRAAIQASLDRDDVDGAIRTIERARIVLGPVRMPALAGLSHEIGTGAQRIGCEAILHVQDIKGDSASFSPDGRHFLVTSDSQIDVFESETGQAVLTVGETPDIVDASFDRGDLLRAIDAGGTCHTWSLDDGQRVDTVRLGRPVHLLGPGGLIFADRQPPDDNRIVVDRTTGRAAALEVSYSRLEQHLVHARFSRDGRFLVAQESRWDPDISQVVVWDVATGAVVQLYEGGKNDHVCNVALSPDGIHAVWQPDKYHMALVDLRTGEKRWTERSGRCYAFAPDGRFVFRGGGYDTEGDVVVFDVATGKSIHRAKVHEGRIEISPDGRYLLVDSRSVVSRWAIDWRLAVPHSSNWQSELKPFLEVFLTATDGSDVDALVRELQGRGFGWIPAARIVALVDEMRRAWQGPVPLPAIRRPHFEREQAPE